MDKGEYVKHKKSGLILKVVSPASKNGGKEMICERPMNYPLGYLIITDKPSNFAPIYVY